MDTTTLLPLSDKKEISDASRTLYQRKVGSLLFAAIAMRPDIAFAVFRLLRFNQRPGKTHHKAADRVFHFLSWTQDYCICYRGETRDVSSFVCASDTSFADNSLDRKISQGYMIKLFGVQSQREPTSRTQSPLLLPKQSFLQCCKQLRRRYTSLGL